MRTSANALKLFAIALLLVVTSGCANESAVERDFGNSARHVFRAQTLDPIAAVAPDPEPVDYGDGQRLEAVIDAYREDVAKPKDIGQDIVIKVGN